jgi:hypothetical protein
MLLGARVVGAKVLSFVRSQKHCIAGVTRAVQNIAELHDAISYAISHIREISSDDAIDYRARQNTTALFRTLACSFFA